MPWSQQLFANSIGKGIASKTPLTLVFQGSKACNGWAAAKSGYVVITTSTRPPVGSTLQLAIATFRYSTGDSQIVEGAPPDGSRAMLPIPDASTSAELIYISENFITPTTIPPAVEVTLTGR